MAFLDPVLNPIFQPLLSISPLLAVVIISLVISVIITLVYKYFTNQEEMKRLKDQQKEFQGKLKELRTKPEEMMKVQKEAMKSNLEYMKHSFKPTLITMLPIILIFGWMNAHLAFEPIYPGETFSVTAYFKEGMAGKAQLTADEGMELVSEKEAEIAEGKATWNLKGSGGVHFLTVKMGDVQQQKKVVVTEELNYENPLSTFQHSDLEKITINYNKLRPLGPGFTVPLFNWQPGWLGLYIIFSLVFSLGLRKAFNLY